MNDTVVRIENSSGAATLTTKKDGGTLEIGTTATRFRYYYNSYQKYDSSAGQRWNIQCGDADAYADGETAYCR